MAGEREKPAVLEKDGLSTAQRIAEALEDDILNDRLKPRTRLDEQAVAQRFNVSRTPVREALRHLASSGLIELRRNQGAVVRAFTVAQIIEMFQVMAELEGLSARLSARRMSPAERRALRAAHEACASYGRSEDEAAFFTANNAFHEVIYRGAHNAFLMDQTVSLRNRVNPYRRFITTERRMLESVAEHGAVVEAIEAGEAERAHGLMRAHVNVLAEAAADMVAILESRRGAQEAAD